MIDEYFEWLFKIATNDKSRRYRELCEFLFSKDFYYTNEYDANRVGDGLNLRERFIDEHRMSIMDMQALRGFKCSVLEMMIGLFTVRKQNVDMRKEEYWYQAMIFFNEYLSYD